MAWLEDFAEAEGAADAELLAAIAAAGEGDEGAAQPAADLPAWVREAAPLSERPADEDAQLPAEERAFEGVAGSEAPSVPEGETREEESALLAEWEAWEAAQESVAPVGEGGEPLESGTSEEGWLASFVLAESEPTQEEASLAEIGDEAALLDELVGHSLVQPVPGDEAARFALAEPVRAFVREHTPAPQAAVLRR